MTPHGSVARCLLCVSDALVGVDTSFWNRIAHVESGRSGPDYLEGWICALIGFDDKGRYLLPSLEHIKATNSYGCMVFPPPL